MRLTTCPEAATSYRCGVRRLLMDEQDPIAPIATALAVDPTFALAHVALALLSHAHGARVDREARVRDAALHSRRSTAAERSHVEAVLAWLDGDPSVTRRHRSTYPRDALVDALVTGRLLVRHEPAALLGRV